MQRCLDLAIQGQGNVAPNPMVGAVLVYEGQIIGEGHHKKFGEAHAEVEAFHAVRKEDEALIPGSTLYVNMEPCSHYGKTPPCANLILEHNIKKVVIAQLDPNPIVSGRGSMLLRDRGVEVIEGILEKESKNINRRFNLFHSKHRPYVILKWAQTAEGFIASPNGSREPISDQTSMVLSHLWRSQEQAIMVGYRTALLDNPSLTTRLVQGNNPVRLVIDYENSLPRSLNVFDKQALTYVFTKHASEGNNTIPLGEEEFYTHLMKKLYQLQITSVMIEGGAKLLSHFINNNLWDEARVFHSPKMLNVSKGIKAPCLPQEPSEIKSLNNDQLHIYFNL